MTSVDRTAPDRPLPGASPLVAYARYWRRYAVFSGRASRSEYWWAALLNGVLALVTGVVVVVLVLLAAVLRQQGSPAVAVPNALVAVLGLLLALFGLAQIVPGIAVSVRRLHDANLSGLLALIQLVPFGGTVLLVLHALPPDGSGRRFDAGGSGAATGSAAPVPPVRAPATPSRPAAFAAWPAPDAAPRTAELHQQEAAATTDPVREAWAAQGAVAPVDPRLSGQPSWRRIGYLHVDRPDGVGVITTAGLAESEGATALGPGAEVYVAGSALAGAGTRAADDWRFALVASVARRIGASGMHLPAELEQHGALSMAVPVRGAPARWTAPDGAVGVIVGVPLPGVPETVATPRGEVRLVGVVPLLPEELQRILDDGQEARTAIAGDLRTLGAAELASPDREAR